MGKVLKNYLIGFVISLVLTGAAYLVVQIHVNSVHEAIQHSALIPILLFFAFSQLLVQLYFFLKIGEEKKPRWTLYFSIFTFIGILIVVLASIWIEYHLNYNMMPDQMNQYIQDQSGGF